MITRRSPLRLSQIATPCLLRTLDEFLTSKPPFCVRLIAFGRSLRVLTYSENSKKKKKKKKIKKKNKKKKLK